jgi:hypothetical protein
LTFERLAREDHFFLSLASLVIFNFSLSSLSQKAQAVTATGVSLNELSSPLSTKFLTNQNHELSFIHKEQTNPINEGNTQLSLFLVLTVRGSQL